MFGVNPMVLAIIVLAAIATAGIAYGLLYSRIEVEKKTATRINRVKAAETDTAKVKEIGRASCRERV